ncbi:MAG TPA: hotdog domain-containing protein [Candidatus Bathyarchaeia archaeon]|nr:hotdog domain-containing protein [Candidatus Bathyarchaeia archaeon]
MGEPLEIRTGEFARARLKANSEMTVDNSGLIHGGFTFGLADYAAMIAVNEPYVVLASARVRFTRPVRVGEELMAEARVIQVEGRKRNVEVKVSSSSNVVFHGEFMCAVLEGHVLEGASDNQAKER